MWLDEVNASWGAVVARPPSSLVDRMERTSQLPRWRGFLEWPAGYAKLLEVGGPNLLWSK